MQDQLAAVDAEILSLARIIQRHHEDGTDPAPLLLSLREHGDRFANLSVQLRELKISRAAPAAVDRAAVDVRAALRLAAMAAASPDMYSRFPPPPAGVRAAMAAARAGGDEAAMVAAAHAFRAAEDAPSLAVAVAGESSSDSDASSDTGLGDSGGASSLAAVAPLPPLASPRSRRAATAARAAELRALAAATNSEVAVPVRHAADAPATAAPRPPAQLVMGGPLPTQARPARIASNPEMVVPGAADPEMEHPVA